jgi:hypothetical protein
MEHPLTMRFFGMARYALGVVAASAILSACSAGSQNSLAPGTGVNPSALHGGVLAALRLSIRSNNVMVGHSGVAHAFNHIPKGKKTTLLYVSDEGNGSVEVYDYPSGKEVGAATGFEYPYGECSDKKGDVFVADFELGTLSELKYGSTTATTFASGLTYPIGCSVDKQGDIAVSQFEGGAEGTGSVMIYAKGSKTGTPVDGPSLTWPPSYDAKGNLYVEGEGGSCGGSYAKCVAYLAKGGSSFSTVTLSGATIDFPGSVERDSKNMLFGDQEYQGNYTTGIYTAKCKGASCKVSGTTELTDNCFSGSEPYNDTVQWAEYSKKPNLQSQGKVKQVAGGNLDCSGRFNMWNFPAGGNPTGQISGPSEPEGATIVN